MHAFVQRPVLLVQSVGSSITVMLCCNLDSDDDESDLAQAMAECPDPQGSNAVDTSVEIKCMPLKEA